MYKNKENYRAKINASPLFSLEKGTDAFRKEAYKMVENIYCYLMCVNESKYIEFALEITETANRCIKNFQCDGTDFLNYFNAAWAKEYRRAYAKQNSDNIRVGIHISEEDDRNIRKILKFAEQKHISEYTDDFIKLTSAMLDINEAKVRDYIQMNSQTSVVSEYSANDDGEYISIFDTIIANESNQESEEKIEILDVIEIAYLSLQERQKPIVSALMTNDICKIICEYSLPIDKYSFIDSDIVKNYIKNGTVMTQRELAIKFNKNEASLSRTKREFIEKLNKLF